MKVQAPERTPFSRRSREDWTGLESWKGFLFSHELGRKHTELPSLPTKVAVEIHPMGCKAATTDSDQTESGTRDPSCVSQREEERTLSRVCHCWRAFLLAKTWPCSRQGVGRDKKARWHQESLRWSNALWLVGSLGILIPWLSWGGIQFCDTTYEWGSRAFHKWPWPSLLPHLCTCACQSSLLGAKAVA